VWNAKGSKRRNDRRLQGRKRGFSSCGRPVKISLSSELLTLLSELNLLSLPFFKRARVQSEIFTSSLYDEKKKKCNSYVKFLDVNQKPGYALVNSFIKDSDQVYVVLS